MTQSFLILTHYSCSQISLPICKDAQIWPCSISPPFSTNGFCTLTINTYLQFLTIEDKRPSRSLLQTILIQWPMFNKKQITSYAIYGNRLGPTLIILYMVEELYLTFFKSYAFYLISFYDTTLRLSRLSHTSTTQILACQVNKSIL